VKEELFSFTECYCQFVKDIISLSQGMHFFGSHANIITSWYWRF